MKIRKKKFRLEVSFEKILLFFRLSKHKSFEIEFYFKNEFGFNSELKCFVVKRPSDDWKCAFEFENSFLYLSIGLIDYRLWDEYSDKPIDVSYQKYNEMTKGKSSVYISHRLASTHFCDRIILIEGSAILEEGTHQQLMEKAGRYAELFAVQSKYYEKGEEGNEG